MKRPNIRWQDERRVSSKKYLCGYCGNLVASENGYFAEIYPYAIDPTTDKHEYILICHYCLRPTYFDVDGNQMPSPIYGNSVSDVPEKVETLYNEARNCLSCNAYTASVLCSRKLLMNIAVSKGAKEGQKFIEYVNFLSDKNYIPPDGKDWVDHIRKKGNEATHEISIMKREDATKLITFIEMLLKFMYEFPASIKIKTSDSTPEHQN